MSSSVDTNHLEITTDGAKRLEPSVICSLAILSLIGLIDAISYMAVSPSLIFYVNHLGGTKEQYGLIMSTFSFAAFCLKPIYGRWVDWSGNRYRIPYIVSFTAAILGNLIYFAAILMPQGIYGLLIGRFLAGMGAANNALGYSYIATVIPPDKQTSINVLLSMTRIVGMTLGPFINLFLGGIDTEIHIGSSITIPLNPYNSVGLFVAAGQLLVLTVALLFFNEPPVKEEEKNGPTMTMTAKAGMKEVWEAVSCVEIVVPLIIIVVVNCNFQLIETAFPPATAHGLGWGPVQTSSVMGSNAVLMFFLMMLVMILSVNKVSDTVLVLVGSTIGTLGGVLVYYLWTYQAPVWHFVLPIVISISGFPFIMSSNRSNFTAAVKSKAELENAQSMMQAIMSMGASVGGFVAPSMIAAFVMRSPEAVEASTHRRELTPAAWYVPISSAMCMLALWYQSIVVKRREKTTPDAADSEPSEHTGLLSTVGERRRSSVIEIGQEFSRENEVNRRSSTEIMGVPFPFNNNEENEIRQQLWNDKKEWEEIHRLSTLEE